MIKDQAESYFGDLASLAENAVTTDGQGNTHSLFAGVERTCDLLREVAMGGNKAIFVGNGASSSIASHQALDFWKRGGIRAVAFNDHALLTAVSNDLGYEWVFAKPIEMFAERGDVLIAISSSGNSRNILNAVDMAKEKSLLVVSLSGMSEENRLRGGGCINFYVPDQRYGHVEIVHLSILHCIIDLYIHNYARSD